MNIIKAVFFTAFAFAFSTQYAVAQQISQEYSLSWEKILEEKVDDDYSRKYLRCLPCGTAGSDGLPIIKVNIPLENNAFLTDWRVEMSNWEEMTAAERQIAEAWGDESREDEIIRSPDRNKTYINGHIQAVRRSESGRWVKATQISLTYTLSQTPPTKGTAATSFATNSVLASGSWYKVSVSSSGLTKITPALLQEMGAPSSISSNSIQVYGNRGGMLPERVGDAHVDDLEEVAVIMQDGGDGVFNGSDYILFYASGPHKWEYNESQGRFLHAYNIYSDNNYYFIRIDGSNGKRVSSLPEVTGSPTHTVNSFDDYAFLDEDKVNIQRVGRQWFGDAFDFTLSYNYTFPFPNLVPGENAFVQVQAAARSTTAGTSLQARYSGNTILTNNFTPIPGGSNSTFATQNQNSATFQPVGNSISLNLTFNNQVNPGAVAWLDYIRLNVRRQLQFASNAVYFRDKESIGLGNIASFEITQSPAAAIVWDISDPLNCRQIPIQFAGTTAQFFAETDSLRQFVVFNGSDFRLPRTVGKVENQNLHGLGVQDMLIITFPGFRTAAERLAEHRRNHNGYNVTVVSTPEIYNEFHSGAQDLSAIRNFIRSQYVKAPGGAGLKYVCLMGTASYDYKDIEQNNTNFVPVYQSPFSLNVETSFISDDFLTFMDVGEGLNLSANNLDVAVGRLTVRSGTQANTVVDKIIHYETGAERFGDWRNRMLFVTDDVDLIWEVDFMRYSDRIIDTMRSDHPSYNYNKIYADAYEQVSTAGSQRYPDVQDEIFRQVQNGSLIVNYVGHGGETGWAQEQILRLQEINAWTNRDRLSIFVTITCDFSRFDEVWRASAGEQTLTNPNGGTVALLSTTRVVGAFPAMNLNVDVFSAISDLLGTSSGTIGEITRIAKNSTASVGARVRFSVLGDPATTIPFPNLQLVTDEVRDMTLDEPTDTIRALSKVQIKGRVLSENNVFLDQFNGLMDITIFDKPVQRQTLVNDGVGDPYTFTTQNNVIHRGKVSVQSGLFTVNFITPLDISYQFGPGRFSYYAKDDNSEAKGHDNQTIVGGLDSNAAQDEEGPEISLYMNDETFVFGGMTDESPDIFALLADSSGINVVGNSIGHDLVAILDYQTDNPIVLNDYYTADLNSFQTGSIRYPLFDLEEGPHHLSLRAWDVHNNPSTAQLEFVVSSSSSLALKHVLNYPNPFTTHTLFQFEHNRPSQPLDVQVQIFTVSGKLVKTINTNVLSHGNRVVDDISWDGLDDFGDKIGKGVYIYRLKVRSSMDDAYAEKVEKLVILR